MGTFQKMQFSDFILFLLTTFCLHKSCLTLSVPNFRRHLSSAFFLFILINYRLERRLYVKLKD